jgi:hypothetical protein
MPLLEDLEIDLRVMNKMTDSNTSFKLYYHPLESTLVSSRLYEFKNKINSL